MPLRAVKLKKCIILLNTKLKHNRHKITGVPAGLDDRPAGPVDLLPRLLHQALVRANVIFGVCVCVCGASFRGGGLEGGVYITTHTPHNKPTQFIKPTHKQDTRAPGPDRHGARHRVVPLLPPRRHASGWQCRFGCGCVCVNVTAPT